MRLREFNNTSWSNPSFAAMDSSTASTPPSSPMIVAFVASTARRLRHRVDAMSTASLPGCFLITRITVDAASMSMATSMYSRQRGFGGASTLQNVSME